MLGMATYPLPFARYRPFFTEGVTLAVVSRATSRADAVVPPTVKHRSRINWHVADTKARERTGVPHALAVSIEIPDLIETSVANLLAVNDGFVISPPRGQILDGISLRVTQELCAGLGIGFAERPVMLHELMVGQPEVLLTGTGFCLAGVRDVWTESGNRPIQVDWPGPVFKKLLSAWSDLVGVDIEKQFTE
jgi:branched-subunit amino acid aminotransferase/4-amino-4-deoxychorismate lyase